MAYFATVAVYCTVAILAFGLDRCRSCRPDGMEYATANHDNSKWDKPMVSKKGLQPDIDRRTLLALAGMAGGAAAWPGMAKTLARATDITSLDARTLSLAIHARRLSCVDVMQAYLDQIDSTNPKVNAIIALQDRDGLIGQARARDADLARGRDFGIMHGFPHAVKDLSAVRGLPFTQGSPIFRDFVAKTDAIPVERLRNAGAIFIGKTNTPEFGLGSHTYNPVYGVTRNPYDLSKSAGGSSGGAAVAVTTRMVPVADGSDYGGSLRNPPGWNNVYGFRTSIGRVPVNARDDWMPSMGVTGPIARTVGDLAFLLSVQAGYDPRAPLSMESSGDQFRRISNPIQHSRIAWSGDFRGQVPYDPEVLKVCREGLKHFEGLGCHVEEAIPDYPVEKVWQAFVGLRGWQQGLALLEYYKDPERRKLLKPEAIYEIETGLALSGAEIINRSNIRSEWSREVRRFLDRYDYWIIPTAQIFPFSVDQHWPTSVAGEKMRTYHEWMKAVCLVTMSGCPALAAPAGFSRSGLPMGFQIISQNHREIDCLSLASAYELARVSAT